MNIISNPTLVNVSAPRTSALSVLAQSMAAGTWAEITGVSNQWNSLCNTGGNSGHIIGYGNNAAWDPINRQIHIVGNDHGATSISHAIYNEVTNTWLNRVPTPMSVGHAYDHIDCQPNNGRLYFRNYNTNTYDVWYKDNGGSWTAMTGEPASNGFTAGAAVAVSYWSGPMKDIPSGCLVLTQTALGGQVALYDPAKMAWAPLLSGGGSGTEKGAYHDISAYSAKKNCLIFGGANDFSTNVSRLNADKTITPDLAQFPPRWGILRGNCVADPITGNFLIRTGGNGFYEYNPSDSGSYRELSGAQIPPTNLGASNFDPGNLMSVAIPEYGVVVYITASKTTGGCHMHLYKHA